MIKKLAAKTVRSGMLTGALLVGVWGADSAFAFGDPLGQQLSNPNALNFTLASNPGAPDGGGGPFLLALSDPTQPTLLTNLKIPSQVMSWCIDLSQNLGGNPNTGTLFSQAVSKLGGFVMEGLKWLNISGGAISFTQAGQTHFNSFSGWTAAEVAAAIQQEIWNYQLNIALPTTIDGKTASGIYADLNTYAQANQAAYYRIDSGGYQDQIFAVPGPIVGAGLPGLLLACGGLLVLARRRRQVFA